MRLVLLGPPGAGKGTQARMLEKRLNTPQVASGDLLRSAVRSRTALGLQAKRYMDKGALVPDDLVLKLIDERLRCLAERARKLALREYCLEGLHRVREITVHVCRLARLVRNKARTR